MARLLGPDNGDKLVYVLRGAQMYAATGMTAIAYAASTGGALADILADDNGTPGSAIPGSQLAVDSLGLLPDFWFPDGQDTVWIEVGTGPRVPVHAAFDPRIDAVAGAAAAALPLAGGVLSGALTVLPGSSGPQNAIVVGDGSVSREIEMVSSYSGGQDTAANTAKFDSTSRINFYVHQQAFNASYGEPIRIHLRRRDAKGAITWKGPTAWNAWSPDPDNANNLLGGDPANSDKNWAWIIAHYESNDHDSIHGHLSVELPDDNEVLQTRLEFPIWAPDGSFGMDQSNIKTNLSHFTVRASNSLTLTPNFLRIAGSTAYPKYLEFSLSTEPSVAPNQVRFQVGVNTDGESTSNAGSNFVLRRYADNGSFIATALFVSRASGNVSVGSSADESARVAAVWGTNTHHGFVAKPSVALSGTAAFASVLQAAADRVGDHRVVGDSTARLVMFLDKIEIGSGAAPRDVTLYRAGPDLLKTDDKFLAAAGIGVGNSAVATSLGSVARKIQVFDASGASLGFVPVYDAIT